MTLALNTAPLPLLLGPADREAPALQARRAHALAVIARARIENAWLRFAATALAAIISWGVFESIIALYWTAGLAIVIFADRQFHVHQLKRCKTGDPPAHMPWMIAWTAVQSAYGNGLAAILWFTPLAVGQTLSAIFLCCSLANAAATLRRSPPLAMAGLAPTIAYLLGLPIAEFVLAGADNTFHLVPLIGALLLLAWGTKLWQTLLSSDAALAHAEASALRERQAAAAAAAAKTDTIRRMNDELRTPMAALIGAGEHLRRAAATSAARAHIATIVEAGEVLQLVLADLSDLDRLENGEVRIEPKRVDPRELARGVVSAFRAPAQDKQLELFLDIAPQTPHCVEIDAARVRQILFNVLANAVRYTGQGGVRVRLTAEPAETPGRTRLVFEVADTGCGMSRSQLALIFGRVRLGPDGPGLGLSISLRLARLMGGELTARSELNQGALVTFKLDAPVVAQRPIVPRSAA